MTSAIDQLERWVTHGGTCRLEETDAAGAEVVLCRCDGGEEVERFRTSDAAVIAWVRRRAD
ncbi:hypothetical protein [Aeromicrobium choanae]|uniref:Uncharacterized protein n=1 Tax=Aeromicrobium choanae TaxID=1736691 RepID=A0A1T4Z8F5_9ACTN|nr:hypothetical protein [Aeromicrobium choanae]SKB09891.1 hypothetical protein SAMN06295964_2961 [Aeromicrobium choanae]